MYTGRDGRLSENKRIGLFTNTRTIYVSAKDLGKPKVGCILEVDDIMYHVAAVSDEGGIRQIVLSRCESR